MKIRVKNLGPLRQAEFELGDLTIICGANNTGKTYATYALYGFLSYWWEAHPIDVPIKNVGELLSDGVTDLDIKPFISNAGDILHESCVAFTKKMPNVFASSEKHFYGSEFQVDLNVDDVQPIPSFERTMGSTKTQLFSISWKTDKPNVTITLLVDKEKVRIPTIAIRRIIGNAVKEIVFSNLLPHPFIASAERTGAAIFRNDLNLAKNRLVEQMSSMEKEIDAFELLNKVYTDYALPVKNNVDFARRLEDVAKRESFIVKEHGDILSAFAEIIGGEYKVTRNDELYYIPKGRRIKLTMDESSSAVRSLVNIGFYLRHVAERGELLIVDEPELNLHPQNQRLVARLFARLVNIGIKVFITTHSDFIIKELNTLIMLKHNNQHLMPIAKRESYKTEELLSAEKIRVYIAKEDLVMLDNGHRRRTRCPTLKPADIDPQYGISAPSFDLVIDKMNSIQEEIIWGGEE